MDSNRSVSFAAPILPHHGKADLPCFGVLLHVTPMAQNFQILKPLVVLVPIAVVNFQTRIISVVVATLTPSDPLHKTCRRLRRQSVITSLRVAAKHFQTLQFPAFFRPPRRNLSTNLRTLSAFHMRTWLARKSRRHRRAMLLGSLVRRFALAAFLRSRRHWLSALRARNLFSRHVVALIVMAWDGVVCAGVD